jgi:Na+/proline symporter
LNEFIADLEKAIKKRASSDRSILIGIGVFALITLIALGISVVFRQSSGIELASIAFIVAALAAGGRVVMSEVIQQRGIVGATGLTISDAFQRGYQQLLVEFGNLNYNIAISSALVAFFVVDANVLFKRPSSLQVVVNNAYSFLTEIIWTDQDRAQEIDRVAVAAFGPLGVLVANNWVPPTQAKKIALGPEQEDANKR